MPFDAAEFGWGGDPFPPQQSWLLNWLKEVGLGVVAGPATVLLGVLAGWTVDGYRDYGPIIVDQPGMASVAAQAVATAVWLLAICAFIWWRTRVAMRGL